MIFKALQILFVIVISQQATAKEKLKVVTSIPDLAWVASEIGGGRVEAKALLRGTENPHYVDAVPEFTRLVSNADVVCIVGLDLEIGYMPPVLSRSGNANVQPGGKGFCETGKGVTILDKSTGPVDRSLGDVHPQGNPHFWLSPAALAESAKVIVEALVAVDPEYADRYQKNLENFTANMKLLSDDISARLKPVRDAQQATGKPVLMEYHKEFTYFLEHYGLKSFGSLEEKPGVPPSAGRIGTLAISTKAAGIKVVLAADYNPEVTLNRFSELSGIPTVVVPTMIQTAGSFKTYAALQNYIADSLAAGIIRGKLQN